MLRKSFKYCVHTLCSVQTSVKALITRSTWSHFSLTKKYKVVAYYAMQISVARQILSFCGVITGDTGSHAMFF